MGGDTALVVVVGAPLLPLLGVELVPGAFFALASSPLGSPGGAPVPNCRLCVSEDADTVEVEDPTELLLHVEAVRSRFVSRSKLQHSQKH